MDVQVVNELVAMRHQQLARSRGHDAIRAERRSGRREAVRRGWLRVAMWSFGAAVVAPRRPRRQVAGGDRAAQQPVARRAI